MNPDQFSELKNLLSDTHTAVLRLSDKVHIQNGRIGKLERFKDHTLYSVIALLITATAFFLAKQFGA